MHHLAEVEVHYSRFCSWLVGDESAGRKRGWKSVLVMVDRVMKMKMKKRRGATVLTLLVEVWWYLFSHHACKQDRMFSTMLATCRHKRREIL